MNLIPESERSPGEESGNPLQYSCLGNRVDRGAWQATVHGVTKESDMTEQLKTHTHTHTHTHVLFIYFLPFLDVFKICGKHRVKAAKFYFTNLPKLN